MKTFLPYTIACAIVGATIATGCGHKSAKASDGAMDIDVAKVETDSVVLHKAYPGYLSAKSTVDIVARVNGYLRTQNYNAGDYVQRGQILFRVEDTQYRDAVTQAQARLESAQSAYEYAASHYEAVKKALQADAVSQMEVQQAESAMLQSRAEIKNARAALESAMTTLGYCTIKAPFAGHISSAIPDPGAYLDGAGEAVKLATLYDDSEMYVIFFIEDNQYLKMMIEDKGNRSDTLLANIPVTFSESLPHSYTARLDYMAPEIDKGTGALKTRAVIKNPYGELRAGMDVTINLPYAPSPRAVLVKDASIGTDQLGKYVYTVNDSNRVVYTPIKVGELYRDSMRIVTEGLSPDTKYVTRAMLKVRNGMEIKPVLTK